MGGYVAVKLSNFQHLNRIISHRLLRAELYAYEVRVHG